MSQVVMNGCGGGDCSLMIVGMRAAPEHDI